VSDKVSFTELLTTIGVKAPNENSGKGWDEILAQYDESSLSFLTPEFVREQCAILKMGADVADGLANGLRLFAGVPVLKQFAWYCREQFFGGSCRDGSVARDWPAIPDTVHESASLFYVYVYLSGAKQTIDHQTSMGIDPAITLDTLSDMELWIRDTKKKRGRWGFYQQGWLALHFASQIFKLGRLQFNFGRYNLPFEVLRRKKDGKVVVLVHKDFKFRKDGQFDGVSKITDPNPWMSEYEETDDYVAGTPISPLGHALNKTVKLSKKSWVKILKDGDTTFGTHIPATGPMTHEECGESFRRGVEFFPKYFPEHKLNAFMCSSWLLDPQFEKALKPDSNIVRFLQEWYLLPYQWATDSSTMERVFGGPVTDLDKAPQETSLQRAIIAHMKAGGKWHGESGLIFPEDLDWGKQVYRTTKAYVL